MATDAQAAFMWLREGAFDLLLIDLMLTGRVSGLDIAGAGAARCGVWRSPRGFVPIGERRLAC